MLERVRIGEEQLREEKKAKEDVKRSEAMMKKENIIMYEGKASFLELAGTINKLLEQLPESTADVICENNYYTSGDIQLDTEL